jgi:hypothetical protein
MNPRVLVLTSGLILATSPGVGSAQKRTVVIDFDKTADGRALDVSLTGRLVANSYLAAFEITLRDVTQGTQVVILDLRRAYEGQAIRAPSGNNALAQVGSNDPVSFTLSFKTPLRSVGFTRPPLIAGPTGITFPEWKATALDAQNRPLEAVGEAPGGYYSDAPPKAFTFKGPGIWAVRFDSDNHHFAAFNAVVLDDLLLVE